MNYIIASMALFVVAAVSATVSVPNANNILNYNPEERPEIAIQQLCAAFPDLQSCQQIEPIEKRKSAYMRFGRSSPFDAGVEMPAAEMEKRKSAYMRFGKRSSSDDSEIEMNKRKSAYMRFGKRSDISGDEMEQQQQAQVQDVNKRKSAYMRFGKRSLESVMNDSEMPQMEQPMLKRKSAYMRFGKRSASDNFESMIDGQEVAKRKSAYMRFGR